MVLVKKQHCLWKYVVSSLLLLSLISGCGKEKTLMEVVDALPIPEQPEPVDMWWDVELPDFSDNVSRPVISLIGEKTIMLSLGESYEEEGATVADLEDGDISTSIHFEGQVNSNTI